MTILTVDAVDLDRDEYSQYEEEHSTITATIFGTPSTPANLDSLTIEIRKARRNRDVVVAGTTFIFDGVITDFDSVGVNVTFYLPDIVSSPSLLRLMRAGNYFIHAYETLDAEATPGLVADSEDFRVAIVTVDRFRSSVLFGLDLQAAEVRKWKLPPRQILGVTLVEISRAHPAALFALQLNVNTVASPNLRTLSWAGGPPVIVDESQTQIYILPCSQVQEFVQIKIDPNRLPTTSITELLLVEEEELSDIELRRHLDQAKSQIENSTLHSFIEPTRCVTDIDPTQITFSTQNLSPIVLDADWDEITVPVTFYPKNAGKWIDIQLPIKHVLRVDSLFGAVANTRIVDINLEWIEIGEAEGFLQLVPFNQEIAFDFIGLVWVESLRGHVEIPSFWRYNLIAGLRDVPFELIEWIGRAAAIPILTIAGQAFRSGYSAQSVSRDGVSESVSYTASAIYGIYSASIEDHKRWIKEHRPQFLATYRGMTLMVI